MRALIICSLCVVLLCGQSAGSDCSSPKTVKVGSFYVVGYAVRTNNADEVHGRGRIGELWKTFMEHNLGARIPNRVDGNLIVVYSHYASDERGPYDYLLGARVSSLEGVPAEMTYREVAAGLYALFTTRPGRVDEVVPEQWSRIWETPPAVLGGIRAFITDYEVYDWRSGNHAQVTIHVGLKPAPR